MIKRIRRYLPLPSPYTQAALQSSRLLEAISLVCFSLSVLSVAAILIFYPRSVTGILITTVLALVFLGPYLLARQGKTWLASLVLTSLLWLCASAFTIMVSGMEYLGYSLHIIVILIASLLFGYQAGLFFLVISTAVGLGTLITEIAGFRPPQLFNLSRAWEWTMYGVLYMAIAVLLHISFRTIQELFTNSKRKEGELQRRVVQIQVAAEVARDVASVRNFESQLNRVVELITERFGYYYAGLYLVDHQNDFAVLKSATGEAGLRLLESGYRLSLKQPSIVAYVARTGAARVADDINRDSQHLKNPLLPMTRSEMALPLIADNKVIGVLDVQNLETNAFDDADVAVLQTLADQLAVAFESTRLFDSARRQLQEMRVVHAVAAASAQTTDQDDLIERATQIIGDAFFPDNFGVILVDETTGLLIKHASYREKVVDAVGAYPLGVGITGKCAQDGNNWRVSDTTQEPAYLEVDPHTRSELCVPLSTSERIIGVINTESTQVDAFSEDDERLLSTLAGQLATGIQKARLYESYRRQLSDLEILLATSLTMSESLDVETALRVTAQQITALLGAEGCVISVCDNEQTSLQIKYSHTTLPAWRPDPPGTTFQLKNYPGIRRALNERSPIERTASDLRTDSADWPWMHRQGCKSWLVVPMVARDQTLGIVEVLNFSSEKVYTSQESGLYHTLINLLSSTLDNARLYEAQQRRGAELEALRMAGLRLTSTIELSPVLDMILEQALSLVSADDVHVYLYDGQKLSFSAARSQSGPKNAPSDILNLDDFNNAVVQSDQQIFVTDMATHPLFQHSDVVGSIIGLPLHIGERVLGVMSASWKALHRFNQDELRILQLFADQASLALENARLFARVQETANVMSAALARAQDVSHAEGQEHDSEKPAEESN